MLYVCINDFVGCSCENVRQKSEFEMVETRIREEMVRYFAARAVLTLIMFASIFDQ